MPRITIQVSHETLNRIKPFLKSASVEQYVLWALQDKLEQDQKAGMGRY